MSPLNREELVELGMSVPTGSLTQWALDQLTATRGRESRLELRGVGASDLAELRRLIDTVEKGHRELGDAETLPPPEGALAERLRVEALGYWREAKWIARIAFAGDPDILAKFRTGVQTGLLLKNLMGELVSTTALLREHSLSLARYGATEAFIGRGAGLVTKLRDAKATMDAACRDLSPAATQQFHDKGLLYDRTRTLVRIGRLEFHRDPSEASDFNFTLVHRDRGVSLRPRLNSSRSSRRR